MSNQRPDYGIDAPGVIRNLLLIGIPLTIAGLFIHQFTIGSVTFFTKGMFQGPGISMTFAGLLMLIYSKHGKFRHRDRMLKMVNWKGSEAVLDVGTGRGLMAIAAAKHLTTGKAVGIDVWKQSDLSDNTRQNTLRNAEMEGVADKVTIENQDARQIQFPDCSFDVILSNLCLHNIPEKSGRDQACREIARVLRSGGKAVISDFIHTNDYADVFRKAGLSVKISWDLIGTFPPLRIMEVEKPAQ